VLSFATVGTFLRRLKAGELGGLAGDSFYVGIWQAAISVADLAQIALITHVLGLHEYGRLALVLSFVLLVGQFFDVRVGVAATTFGSRTLVAGDLVGAAGIFQLSYLIDAGTGILGFAVVAALAPFVGPHLIGAQGTWLILLYALTLLVSTVDESSISVLRLLDRFRLIAAYTVVLEAARVGAVASALVISKNLMSILLVLVVYDLAAAIANAAAASFAYRRIAHRSLRSPSLAAVDRRQKRAMLRTVLHTNFVSYARLSQQQLPAVVLGALSGTTQVAIYKVGTAAATIVARTVDPFYAALLPRLSRLFGAGRTAEVRRLVGRATFVAAPAIAAVLIALIVLRHPALDLIGGSRARSSAATVLILAALAQAVNGVLFWNIGLLFAAGRAGAVAVVAVAGALIQIGLLVPLAAFFEANGAAAALLASYVVTNVAATVLALRVIGWLKGAGQTPELRESPLPASRGRP
jgi:O-antigen/teichoic acid export membrane protein